MHFRRIDVRNFLFHLSGVAIGFSFCMDALLVAGSMGDWEFMKDIRPQGYVCGFSAVPLVIDGKLDDASWQSAPWTQDFVDIEADRKPKPRQRTRAKMLWDSRYLYIAAELSEQHIQGSIVKHDAVIFQDNDFEVFIDPDGDNHAYYEFEMNALNTTWDLFLPRPYKDAGTADNSWEFEGLKSAVHLQGTLNNPSDIDTGWTLEIAIPWASFGKHANKACPPNDGDRWRIDFSRVEWQFDIVDGQYRKVPNTKEDNWVWSPQGIIDMHRPERWGFVQFSSAPAGSQTFAHDESLPIRDTLMEIYHRQRAFQAKNGKWASNPQELELGQTQLPQSAELSMQLTDAGYQATIETSANGKALKRWHVQQDSRLWETPSNPRVQAALDRAGPNRSQLERALEQATSEHTEAIEFLIANMPERDLQSLSADFLLENTRLAYEAWNTSAWKDKISREIFLNNVLPYANINESRDEWRKDFRQRFLPLIAGAKSPSQAAAMLNQKLFPLVNVRYSTKRAKADQSPVESIKSGLASCTGLSILLIDACRACGIPARFVGTPLWSDNSGNHSWVEVWDDGWHFTGAAEPNGDELDKAWFIGRASTAVRDNALNAIYAVSFQQTPQAFPLVWDRSIDYIRAVNVTDRYTNLGFKPPEGSTLTMFRVADEASQQRIAAEVNVLDANGLSVFKGTSKDERFDANDHLLTYLPSGQEFTIEIRDGQRVINEKFRSEPRDRPINFTFIPPVPQANQPKPAPRANQPKPAPRANQPKRESNDVSSSNAIDGLAKYLAVAWDQRPAMGDQAFAKVPLTKLEATEAMKLLWEDHVKHLRDTRTAEMEAREIVIGSLKMPFAYQIFGEKPASGRSLVLSMHGGGGAPPRVNTQQWENQKKLYQLEEGVYVAPRAPTDTWDLWHQGHIGGFFDRLIENFIVFEGVDPNRVYLMGYSAGGDGVFQLAPRMADRFAAASMMAGHPNETSPLGLRNLPFTIHMGENDAAYNRNKIAATWAEKLAELQRNDSNGYPHLVKIHAGKGHWMDRQDAEALPWMAKYTRDPFPKRIVWKQDDVVENRFYWMAVDQKDIRDRAQVIANRDGQNIDIVSKDVDQIRIRLNDSMIDFDQSVRITSSSAVLFEGKVDRTIEVIAKSLAERGDPKSVFQAEVNVSLTSVSVESGK